MSMPGFSAEASLYSRSARYQVRAMLAGLRQAGHIVPSMKMECDWDDEDHYCRPLLLPLSPIRKVRYIAVFVHLMGVLSATIFRSDNASPTDSP